MLPTLVGNDRNTLRKVLQLCLLSLFRLPTFNAYEGTYFDGRERFAYNDDGDFAEAEFGHASAIITGCDHWTLYRWGKRGRWPGTGPGPGPDPGPGPGPGRGLESRKRSRSRARVWKEGQGQGQGKCKGHREGQDQGQCLIFEVLFTCDDLVC